ncbi:MAG: hypothetical protein WBE18_05795, partial [Gammaproteobacteria bacterium]
MKIKDNDNEEFMAFAKSIKNVVTKHGVNKDWTTRQFGQLTNLLALEKKFRETLIADPDGSDMYKQFIKSIVHDRGNILTARPYFRERQKKFSDFISPALRYEKVEELSKYAINYQFVSYVMKHAESRLKGVLQQIVKELKSLRNQMVEENMPLAINRARVFYSRTPKSHLTCIDLVLICAQGLCHGVDKYTPDETGEINTKQFRSTIIGVMGGLMIENYSQTMLHFFPQDKRKLYRANKVVGRLKGEAIVDFQAIADAVNITPEDSSADFIKTPTNAEEIAEILAAASTVSADS